ncbi:hypothetical protein D9M71_528180 [compost metagenome]
MFAWARYASRGYNFAIEAWRHGGLQQTVPLEPGTAGNVMRMSGGFVRGQNRGEANIGALKQFAPMRT